MKSKIFLLFLLTSFIFSFYTGYGDDDGAKIVAYYFHGNSRCSNCVTIEKYSREAIEKYFVEELQNGKLEFKTFNTDKPENRHYIQDYQLYTKSLVVVLYKNNEQIKWKNLSDVWLYLRNKEKFYQYVKDEVEKFLQEIEQ